MFDGLISYVPSILDFEWQGIDRPEALAKRLVQTEKETAILELLYHAGGLVRGEGAERARRYYQLRTQLAGVEIVAPTFCLSNFGFNSVSAIGFGTF